MAQASVQVLEWNNHWIANRWFLVDADFAWTHARYAKMNDNGTAGDLIPNAVNNAALLRGAIHDVGPWLVGIETRYIGQYPLAQDGSLTAPSAIVTNVRVRREISPRMTIFSWMHSICLTASITILPINRTIECLPYISKRDHGSSR